MFRAASALESPFELQTCSWPRAIRQADGRWVSEPEWDAALLVELPKLAVHIIQGEVCYGVDWRAFFKGVRTYDPHMGGEMRGFHVVFRIRIARGGWLVFWDDDGSIIRRDGSIIHEDRSAHPVTRSAIQVQQDDVLEVAQWQLGWDWVWAGRLAETAEGRGPEPVDFLEPYAHRVQQRMTTPGGPPLKMYTNGLTPLRVVAAIYSLVLNGYVPNGVYLFGSEQWSDAACETLRRALPFANVVPTQQVLSQLYALGEPSLVEQARRYWFVMKTCVGLLCQPAEACMLDDDVFILDHLDDALAAFADADLVYAPDQDLGPGYVRTWAHSGVRPPALPLATARFNAGLYWVRPVIEPRALARHLMRSRPLPREPFLWEQGFIAVTYAPYRTVELAGQRYLFPVFDGLPGGILGYDYARNPCGFASVHFGGLPEKPSDAATLQLLGQLLDRTPDACG